jgi:hypothetical protein
MEQTTIAEQQSQSAPVSSEINTQVAPAVAPIEKTLPQSEVNKLVGGVKAEAYEKGRAAALAEFQRQQTAAPTAPAPSFGGMPATQDLSGLVAQQVDQRIQEMQRQIQEQNTKEMGNKIANDFQSRLDASKANYDDFDSVTEGFPFAAFPNTVLTSLNFENTGDIVYELAKNPTKMKAIDDLAQMDVLNAQRGIQSNLAHREMQKLSESIRINRAAQNVKTANPPLSQIQPSPTGTDNGAKTVKDFQLWHKQRQKR